MANLKAVAFVTSFLRTHPDFVRFFCVSFTALILDTLLFALLADILMVSIHTAAAAGVGIGALYAYVAHSLFTFKNKKALTGGVRSVGVRVASFAAVITVVYFVRVGIVSLLLPYVPWATLAYLVGTGLSFLLNFFLSKRIFREGIL